MGYQSDSEGLLQWITFMDQKSKDSLSGQRAPHTDTTDISNLTMFILINQGITT